MVFRHSKQTKLQKPKKKSLTESPARVEGGDSQGGHQI